MKTVDERFSMTRDLPITEPLYSTKHLIQDNPVSPEGMLATLLEQRLEKRREYKEADIEFRYQLKEEPAPREGRLTVEKGRGKAQSLESLPENLQEPSTMPFLSAELANVNSWLLTPEILRKGIEAITEKANNFFNRMYAIRNFELTIHRAGGREAFWRAITPGHGRLIKGLRRSRRDAKINRDLSKHFERNWRDYLNGK